jgi:hypothetical protein
MKIGIDYTSAATQGAGIGRYTRELLRALLLLSSDNRYSLFYASRNRIDQSALNNPSFTFPRQMADAPVAPPANSDPR